MTQRVHHKMQGLRTLTYALHMCDEVDKLSVLLAEALDGVAVIPASAPTGCLTFTVGGSAALRFKKWQELHRATCSLGGAPSTVGDRETWTFTPTSLGVICKVRCACGAELDLTVYENW